MTFSGPVTATDFDDADFHDGDQDLSSVGVAQFSTNVVVVTFEGTIFVGDAIDLITSNPHVVSPASSVLT
jgi:hypothetical protein